jgi:signal transduction histidine kinase
VTAEDRRETYYRALARQTERLHRLVESLLDFGRMEAGTSPYRLEPLDACALIRSVVEEFQQDSAANGYRVELQVDGLDAAPPTIAGDREALTHAVWNLLDNAVKYSPECRTVWVEVERTGSRLAIRVRDRGLGVPRHEHADIFRRFVRGADAKTQGIKGTGIGLAMVRHIVSAHGGDVLVASEPGAGSTFTIILPSVRTHPNVASAVRSVRL